MKILILGGNRFFGRRLAELMSQRHDVTVLNRQSHDDGLGTKVKRIKADRNKLEITENYDVVYDQICFKTISKRQLSILTLTNLPKMRRLTPKRSGSAKLCSFIRQN